MQKYKNKNKHRWPIAWQYVKFPREMIFSKAWADLSPSAKAIYTQMKGKYNASNNGSIRLYFSELRKIKGLKGSKTVSKGFRELEAKGWIKRTKMGGMYGRANEYELTGKHDPSIGWDKLSASGNL
jgi:hypothetical protein